MKEKDTKSVPFVNGKQYRMIGMNSNAVYTCHNGKLYYKGQGMNPEGLKRSSFAVVKD